MDKKRIKIFVLGILAVILSIYFQGLYGESKVALDSEKKVKIGTSYQIDRKGDRYSSKDWSVAWVNQDGMVTAKKIGKTVISVRDGKKVYKQHVTVVANGKKTREVKVSTGEIAVLENSFLVNGEVVKKKRLSDVIEAQPVPSDLITDSSVSVKKPEGTPSAASETPIPSENETEKPAQTAVAAQTMEPAETPVAAATKKPETPKVLQVNITLKNQGRYIAKKVVLYGRLDGKNYKLNFGAIRAGESKTVQKKITGYEGNISKSEMSLQKLMVYSNKMITSYRYETGKTTFLYGTEDTVAPVISGFIGKNSYNQGMPYMVVYGDDKDKGYDYFKYVKAEDDRDTKVELTVNTDKVNYKKAGIYQITYIAKDKAGNKAKAKAKIEVRLQHDVDKYASEILSKIIKKDWSVYQKATAIYDYTRHHISYVGYSQKGDWENGAIQGIRYGRGDCFTYYAVARALLTRAGIPNILVKRYRGAGNHWWNMVYVNGGWYHYDCGPRPGGGRFCMLTDEQLTAYSKTHGNKYIWNYDAVPKSPTKKLTSVF